MGFLQISPEKRYEDPKIPPNKQQSSALLILNFTVTMQTATHISNE